MLNDNETASLMIAASVCAQDGLISESEELLLFNETKKRHPSITQQQFDSYIDAFFSSSKSIEEYSSMVIDQELRTYTINTAKKSASIDGLDFRENIALQKVMKLWGI